MQTLCQPCVGSSPRVRGKLGNSQVIYTGTGLIPACAGKTDGRQGHHSLAGAHPRVCGENDFTAYGGEAMLGSSPRVRGKLHKTLTGVSTDGLIPACAGKTLNDLEF